MEINWSEIVFQIAVVVAVVNFIKHLAKDKLGLWSVAVAMAVAFAVVFLAGMPSAIVWYDLVRDAVIVGLSASGFYTLAGKIGN